MNPLLEQFLSEARDFLQGIGEKLMELEDAPDDADLMISLFRLVHTLKGNSGLFEFPEMTRVLHAGEDLMDGVRHGQIKYSKDLADRLLDAMDFVGILCDEIERNGSIGAHHAADSARLAESLRQLIVRIEEAADTENTANTPESTACEKDNSASFLNFSEIPEAARMDAYRRAHHGDEVHWLDYIPVEECFFQGDDPFFQARNTPDVLWGGITTREAWPKLAELDAYRCLLTFHLLTTAPRAELNEYYRYIPDQVRMVGISPLMLALPQGEPNGGPVYEDFVVDALDLLDAGNLKGLERAAQTMLEISSPNLWLSSALRWLLLVLECEANNAPALRALVTSLRILQPPQWDVLAQTKPPSIQPPSAQPPLAHHLADNTIAPPLATLSSTEAQAMMDIVGLQRKILALPIEKNWHLGRMKAVATTFAGLLNAIGDMGALAGLDIAQATALDESEPDALLDWLNGSSIGYLNLNLDLAEAPVPQPIKAIAPIAPVATIAPTAPEVGPDFAVVVANEPDSKPGRRTEEAPVSPKSLKVDQAKIDHLMNLIGEMIVSKNALPYLASRAESVFGVRELSREIKTHYAVINRIAEEMQDAIMQVRMMPVSFVFQRFPRLVRDISRKLGKEVQLILEGETTEADKNIIESLGDPLVHIVRNSLDHGFETSDIRRAAGKPAVGVLTIRASQESDRVIIEIRDDGKGIDPIAIKHKAYEKGIIDESTLERITDQEAVNLVFAPGFSTVEVISDLSGRGVGMDVVRTAVEKVNGNVFLDSEKGKGTRIRLSLPLSMAITNVMIVESDGQIFGVPMDCVVETVRVRRCAIRAIKKSLATVLRGRIVSLKSINTLLGIDADQKTNGEDEFAVLVVRINDEPVGLMVDNFRETIDIILKPMAGVLAGLSAYAGSALMGDGSVLMVLNVKEVL